MKRATISLENGQTVEIELFEREAPGTVANFEALANRGFYDGLTFHRVVYGFVAQGGCSEGTGRGGTTPIPCETLNNPHKHVRGTVSMAHSGKDTGSCQFFIAYSAQPHLDGRHTAFGRVISGMEHVDRLKRGDRMVKVEVRDSND